LRLPLTADHARCSEVRRDFAIPVRTGEPSPVTPGKDGSERDAMTTARLGGGGVPEPTRLPLAPPRVLARSRSSVLALWLLITLTALLGLMACTAPPASEPPTDRAAPAVVDYAAMETAIEDKINSGSLTMSTIDAVLVSVDGETKITRYRNGSKPEDALHVWSVTKSVVSALIGIAIDEKIISGLDATLPELLPRYQKHLTADERSITLRQLMSMTAGFPQDEPLKNLHKLFIQRTDPIPTILTEGLNLPPGQVFNYSSRSSHLVSAVLREALVRADPDHPRTVLEYAREKLFDPLEIDSSGARESRVSLSDPAYEQLTRFDWATDAAGLHSGCCLLRLRPADMIKVGELYLGGGNWHGKQILPTGWVKQTMTPSEQSSQYGLMWWLDIDQHGHPAWVARGWGGQVIGVVPEHQLVVAIGSVPTDDIEGTDPWPLVNEVIVPALG
jgi:CubicO group peptidase (beta-lactamase class C family)